MKKNLKIALFIAFVLASVAGSAQTLSPTVISSSGGYFTSASASLSFTVAEMTMVQTFSTANNFLTQGFQQPEDYNVGIIETAQDDSGVLIFPNPTTGSITLNYYNNGNSESTIKLYNMVGQVVLSQKVSQLQGLNTMNLDISHYSQGMYMLELATLNLKGETVISYHKINLEY